MSGVRQPNCPAAKGLRSQNMLPFQTAYPMIAFLIYCILAGNTAFVCVTFVSFPGCCSLVPIHSPSCEFPLFVRAPQADPRMDPQVFALQCKSSPTTASTANIFSDGHIRRSCGRHPRRMGLPVFYLTTRVGVLSTCSRRSKPGYCSLS